MSTPPPRDTSESASTQKSKISWISGGIGAVVMLFALASVAGCADDDTDQSAPATTSAVATATAAPSTVTVEAPTTVVPAQASTPAVTPAETATTPAAVSGGIMPAVVCMNLQAAQNLIQENGVFFSRSDDASGEGRSQIIDSNWVVVGQTPEAGTPITEGEPVLSVVKIGETSGC
ncbi:PASTA domain-containing protein [Williamsia sp.]|uniref:PASTA domain-containing protein n=1 Tax=Williamsia sp. TaxID=1872085 RepID=UPI002F92984F